MRIVVTGASGFVGRSLVNRLITDGYDVVPIVRSAQGLEGEQVIDDIHSADWPSLMAGVDAVVHLAARVHMMRDSAADPLSEFRRVNTAGTYAVAKAAANAGVKRFLFLSTIKVNGESTDLGKPFRSIDPARASDAYGVSKQEAESALFELARTSKMTVTVIRPPLIYGPGMKGNMRVLVAALRLNIPLPLGQITNNRRSLVGVDNLLSLIVAALIHPAAANAILLVSDDEDVSTTRLLQILAKVVGVQARLLPIPVSLIRLVAGFSGKKEIVDRLVGNLQVDITDTRAKLGWVPPVPLEAGLRAAVEAGSR